MRKHCFEPVVDAHTRVLVVGSLPGDASLSAAEYYAHPRNAFWPIMAELTATPDLVSRPYAERLACLLAHGVGLWDVIGSARRAGSLDAALRDVAANDLAALCARLPSLVAVACNGEAAYKGARRQLAQAIPCIALPSTSPAHARPFAEKLDAWQQMAPLLAAARPDAPGGQGKP